MRKFMMSVVMLAALTSCATQNMHGNYAAVSIEANKTMADVTVAQLVALYPPAHTRLDFQQTITDPYGAALLSALRKKGYSVLEYNPQPQAVPAKSAATAALVTANPTSGLPLSYVVDSPESMNLYRITVQIGVQSISRAFVVATNGNLYPAGAWVRKE
ncbi:conjugal transfer protein TrbH [Xylella fastidiosa]|uniref:Conjugal transfer protein n=1 Tax=Xylella fastidiosa (strain 9a5c) TaxID=160492 RepID=Q9PHG6_XYLFA|nr:conjugal transfer protein TrbH [Xylella fastidiosa]AAF85610.1 conjugal transfer protein [Xylella fastidiosa 9a5c]ALQ96019.1 conjugal transfer protein TrbH [Xylella fastidiosa]ALR02418.1 conjugal transfer protein TrbH [Xylella fastidiosa]ALR03256.1 conjugal transfer protein TrbH [Xylella fastidiosa]AWG45468.1 conjugal transfer protein TrbH [Xylella fastidiosa]